MHAPLAMVRASALLATVLACGGLPRALTPESDAGANSIVTENARVDGVVPRARWDRIDFMSEPEIGSVEGFSTRFSLAPGDTVHFKVKTPAGSSSYRYEIYRLGWYGGAGARQVWPLCTAESPVECTRITVTDNPAQPSCERFAPGILPNDDVPDCVNWRASADPYAAWHIPNDAVSGVYLARLSRSDDAEDVSHVPFVIRELRDAPRAEVLYQLGDSTWQAYNSYNEAGPAQGFYNDHKQAVSYNRPFRNRRGAVVHGPKHYLFDLDVPLIHFLEANGVSLGYIGSTDLESPEPALPLDSANPLFGRKAYLANGHEEYWPRRRLQNLENAAKSGIHMLFLCANTAYYKTRFVNDRAAQPDRIQIAYKEGKTGFDPLKNDAEWTGVYRDTRPNAWDTTVPGWSRPASAPPGSSNALTGVTPAAVNLVDEPGQPGNVPAIAVPASMKGLRLWRNTKCAAAKASCTLGARNVGFEMDLRADRYFDPFVASQPAGLFSVSATVVDVTNDGLHASAQNSRGYGVLAFQDVADYNYPRYTVEATIHRNAAGALVFATSSFRWSHGLDSARSTGVDAAGVSPDMQQATINLLADMGVQPGSLQAGLVAATASTDHTPPISRLVALNRGTGVVTGVATDVAGAVAGVELSFDAGKTWRGASITRGAEGTSFSFVSVVPANAHPLLRAIDDSGNLELAHGPAEVAPASDGLTVTTIGLAGTPSVSGVLLQQIVPAPNGVRNVAPGFTLLVGMDMNGDALTDLLSYDAVTGTANYELAVAGAPGARTLVKTVSALPGFTSVVPLNIHGEGGPDIADLLSYNAASGKAYYSVGAAPGVQKIVDVGRLPVDHGTELAQGFTAVVPINLDGDALTDLLWYSAATGLSVTTRGAWQAPFFDAIGQHHEAEYRQEVSAVWSAAPGFTSIVPMHMNGDPITDVLSYNASTGLAVYSVGDGRGQNEARAQTALAGFTSIVAFDLNEDALSDLLSYNSKTGAAFFSIATGVGIQRVVGPEKHGDPGWVAIVPMKLHLDPPGLHGGLTDLLFYR